MYIYIYIYIYIHIYIIYSKKKQIYNIQNLLQEVWLGGNFSVRRLHASRYAHML